MCWMVPFFSLPFPPLLDLELGRKESWCSFQLYLVPLCAGELLADLFFLEFEGLWKRFVVYQACGGVLYS